MKKILVLVTVLALVAALVVPLAVSAASPSGTTDISGNINAVIEVVAPGNITGITLTPDGPWFSGAQTATVNSNTKWTLAIKGSSGGFMAIPGTPAVPLYTAMFVKGGSNGVFASDYASLTGLDQTLQTGTPGGALTITNIDFRQAVSWTDPVGAYGITVTFTATSTP